MVVFAPLRRLTARALTIGLVLVAMLTSALVPDGYMVDTNSDGAIVIRMCGETGGRLMLLDPHTGTLSTPDDTGEPAEPLPEDEAAPHCPFAMASAPAMPAPDGIALDFAFGPPLLANKPYLASPDSAIARPPLPPRGPPALI